MASVIINVTQPNLEDERIRAEVVDRHSSNNKFVMKSPPIIIVGAGRSGTNMIRDLLTHFPGVTTWPCDEINYIWRHGNARYPTDVFTREMARPAVVTFIHRKFQGHANRAKSQLVVEKTCANSLRIPFVHAIFPDARFVHIVRDGRDVAVSATQRWCAPLDLPYILRKTRFIPPTDLPYYAARYLSMRLRRIAFREKRVSSWGPRFEGMAEVFHREPIPVACAIQWARCAEKAEDDLQTLPAHRVCNLKYEHLVTSPIKQLQSVLRFLGMDSGDAQCARATQYVRASRVGRWRQELEPRTIEAIDAAVGDVLERFGYK